MIDRQQQPAQRRRGTSHAAHPSFFAGPAVSDAPASAAPAPGGVDLWGGHFERGPAPLMEQINASIGFDKRLYAHDIAGSSGARPHARGGRPARAPPSATRSSRASSRSRARSRPTAFPFSAALEDIHMNIEAQAHRADRRAGPQAAHRALAQRPGRDRFPPLGARRDRRAPTACCATCRRRCWRAPRSTRPRDAGLHPSAGGPAGHARPSSAGLCRDVRARSRPLRRCPRAPQRMPARRRRARRHELSDRPRCDRRRARLRRGRRATRSMPCRIATSRSSSWPRPRSRRSTCRASPRSWCCGRRRSSASCAWPRSSRAAARSCRKSAIPTPPSWCAPRAGRMIGASAALLVVAQGPAARLQQGPAGGQGAGVRRRRQLGPLPRRDGRYDRGHGGRSVRASPPRPRVGHTDRDRSRRLAGARASACRSATRMASRRRRCGGPRRRASSSPA